MRQSERSQIELVERIILNPEVLDEISAKNSKALFKWAVQNLLEGVILTVENWLEVAFHLGKQRWGEAVDWLEAQPMSKVNAMIQVVKNFADEQEQQAKKAARKKR